MDLNAYPQLYNSIVSLIERTREIGILKALGMKSRTVLTIFFFSLSPILQLANESCAWRKSWEEVMNNATEIPRKSRLA